jgi:hypothetical protein
MMPGITSETSTMDRWNDGAVAQLTAFWNAGHTASAIAARLGMSKSAIVSKAHRLGLARHLTKSSGAWVARRRLGALADD